MKNKIFSICTLFLITFSAATCKKENTLEMELAKLPPATQTGQNTFGCLVNGKAWVAQNKDCFPYCDPSFKLYYESDRGGYISLDAVYKNSEKKIDQYIGIGMDSARSKRLFEYSNFKEHLGFIYSNEQNLGQCKIIKSLDNGISTNGSIILTKFDLQSGIISGTFEFTLFKPGCDTIKVTDGRFDKKL